MTGSRSGTSGGDTPLPPGPDPRGRHRGGPGGGRPAARRRHPGAIAARVVAAALSTFLVVYLGFLWSRVHNLDNAVVHLSIGSFDKPPAGTSAPPDADGKDENLLIVGNDDRSTMTPAERRLLHTGSDVSLSTDTMMIVHVPADGSKATLISLPRDSYVSIPGHGMNKLNAAYAYGYNSVGGDLNAKRAAGADLLVRTVQNLTGLTLNHYVQVGLIGFYRIAKAIGGVPVTLCHPVDDTVAHNAATGQDGGSGFRMDAGTHVLNAIQALEFVRQRHNLPNGDIDRTARQRYFLTAAFREVASAGVLLSPNELGNLVKAVDQSLYVDSGMKILDLARQMANLSANNIIGKVLPFVRYATVDVGSVEIIDPAQVRAFVAQVIAPGDDAYAKARPVDPAQVTVTVDNAGATDGAATRATHTLSSAGFTAKVGPDATEQATTVIKYPTGSEPQARTLAGYVPGAAVQVADVPGVTLVLGADGVAPRGSSGAGGGPSGSSSSSASGGGKAPGAIDAHCIN